MPARRKRRAPRTAVAPWVVLSASLAVIGFACTRTGQHARPPAATQQPVAQATLAPVRTAPPVAPQTPAPTATASAPATPSPKPTAGTPQPLPVPSRPPATNGASRLAVIIDDCGQWPATERGFIALPVALTLSVLPDVRFNQTIEREAVEGNKGVMLHLPMETLSGLNPGPGKVTTMMGDDAIIAQVEHDLDDVGLARGVNNHEGSKATANIRVMNDVMTVLARRNRFFIDSRTNSASIAERVANERGVATAGRDVFLDNRADVDYTESQLREAAAIAKRDGSAIAIGHPRATTLIAVRNMIPELEAEGVTFVLASDLTR